MPTARADVLIDAPILLVWQVMLDLAAYPDWNPFVVGIDCAADQPSVGTDLILHVRFPNGKQTEVKERITRLDNPEAPGAAGRALLEYEFQGPLAALHLVRARREQVLEQRSEGQTHYRTEERLHGLLAWAAPIGQVRAGFIAHAQALKQRAEALRQG